MKEQEFWENVDRSGDTSCCWTWKRARQSAGYGYLTFSGRMQLAHRVAYELIVGPIPPELTIDHLCKNHVCVNPAHMEVVDMRTNVLRNDSPPSKNLRKTHCPAGHPFSGDNLYLRNDGHRECRACRKVAMKRYYAAHGK